MIRSANPDMFIIERAFDHPLSLLYWAFTDLDAKREWYGGEGSWEVTDHSLDFRVGGHELWRGRPSPEARWMTSDSGKTFDNTKDFIEIVRPELIVFRHIQPMHDFTMTMSFEAVDAATDLTWKMDFDPGQDSELKPFIQNANEQNLDRLDSYLRNPK